MNTADERQIAAVRLGVPELHAARLADLESPEQVQDFVSSIPMNWSNDTCLSVREVLEQNRAMCIEGALVAACALQLLGEPPLLLRLFASDGEDHAITLFLRDGRWGAISKSNHVWCRWRDPVYLNVRELVMSYFHEYVTGRSKTLRGYGEVLDLRRLSPSSWISGADSCREVVRSLSAHQYRSLFSATAAERLRLRDAVEERGGEVVEHARAGP